VSARTPQRAILLPSYGWNPYQRLLAAALTEQGIEARALQEWPRRAPLLGSWLKAGRPDVLHLHWIHDFLGGSRGTPRRRDVVWLDWQLRLLRTLGVRLVWTVHNLQGHEAAGADRDEVAEERDAAAHRAVIERVHVVISHCQQAQEALVARYAPSASARARMHVVPHGSYVTHYAVDADQAAARARLDLEGAGLVIAFVGAIRAYKGAEELLAAFTSSSALGPDVRLLLGGKPLPRALGAELERRAAADPRIVLRLERLPEEDLSAVLRAADVVALPFRDILTSGSAILALSHGRPVIAPALGCLPETLPEDATFLYDAQDPDALRIALEAAARADLAAMGRAARRYADGLDWASIAARTSQLYQAAG
jgi:glycosyltransferase involved in cell wall biosynthesis